MFDKIKNQLDVLRIFDIFMLVVNIYSPCRYVYTEPSRHTRLTCYWSVSEDPCSLIGWDCLNSSAPVRLTINLLQGSHQP